MAHLVDKLMRSLTRQSGNKFKLSNYYKSYLTNVVANSIRETSGESVAK